ncbi:hypothetical protein [Paenibacillus sp. GCM10012306]
MQWANGPYSRYLRIMLLLEHEADSDDAIFIQTVDFDQLPY